MMESEDTLTASSEDGALSFAASEDSGADGEATAMYCPPSISISPTHHEAASLDGSDTMCEDDDKASSTDSAAPPLSLSASVMSSPMATSLSLDSRSSHDAFPSNSTPSSLSSDRELVEQARSALRQAPGEVETLDLSTNTRKPRRPLKNLLALSDLSNLVHLDVSGNAVERLEGLQALTQLQTLLLARNHLKTLSSPLFTLENLTRLDLSGNFIAHLPRAIAGLTLLETLNLAGNNLSKLREVDVLEPLANLHVCSLAANPFCRLPTYKDYVLSKVQSLERLDDMQISPAAREKSCKRFGAAMYSQDACLREADRAHEHEQNKLLEAQSALEAENLRLRGELNVKSKLLQNKSRAWSSATEQLLQLQQEVAMLNLDRRRSVSLSQKELSGAELAASARHRLLDMNQQRPQSAPRVPSPVRSLEKRRGSSSTPDSHRVESRGDEDEEEEDTDTQFQVRHHSPPSTPTHSNVSGFTQKNDRYLSSRQAFATNVDAAKDKSGSKTLVDASCSPFRVLPPAISIRAGRERAEEDEIAGKAESRSAADSVQHDVPRTTTPPSAAAAAASSFSRQQLKKSQGYDQVRQALTEHRSFPDEATVFSAITSCEMDLKEDEAIRTHELSVSRSARFPTFEDDVACPAYEDEHHEMLQRRATSARDLNLDDRVGAAFYRTASSPDRLPASILSLPRSSPPSPTSPSRLRLWFREQNELRDPTPPASPPKQLPSPIAKSPPSSPLASPLAAFVNKDVLARQIQALNSCKQSLLTEIGNEEQLLHVLKKEAAQYADQIDHLSVNIQACLDGDPSAVRFSFSPPASPQSRGSSKKQREEGIGRAHLEILRNKMRFAEDKEKEIETTMVRMTNRVLQVDLHSTVRGATASSLDAVGASRRFDEPFEKEIFALTHELQLVIVQKEEISMQMSQLMAQMRRQGTKAGGEDEADRIVDSKNALALVKSRQMVSELRTRHREVADRIQLKERRIASLLGELKDVEAELQHISHLNASSARSPLVQSERAASVDFCQMMRLQQASHCGLGDAGDREHMTEILNEAPTEGNASEITATNLPQLCVEADTSHDTSEQGSFPFKLQFKELLTAEMLEEIKADIYEKLSQQLAAATGKSEDENFVLDHKSLHDAIATALETRLKLAMDIYDQQKSDEDGKVDGANTPADSGKEKSASALVPVQSVSSANEVSWGHFDEFAVANTHYARRYVFLKKNVALTPLESSSDIANPAGLKATSRLAGAQRILKACERLETAEMQCKRDPNSNIELDPMGNNRSSLKLLLLAARDLPTAHLRTKNLDPYVSLEVVYPAHVVPLSGDAPSGKVLRSRTKKKSMYPIWDEEFELAPILSLNGYIHVRILNDRRLSREQLVGETRIPLQTLVHQKRIVEWFSLELTVPLASTDSNPPGTVVSKLCGGAVRLQLQLNFSSVERYKRAVDELVTRYLHDHNQLPSFIEAVDQEQKPLFEEMEINEHEQQQAPTEAQFPLDAFETLLPTYDIWKAETQEVSVQNTTMAGSQKGVSTPPACIEAAGASAGVLQGTATQCLTDRRKALWDTKTPPAKASGTLLSGRLSPSATEVKKRALVDSSSSLTERKRLQASATSNAMSRTPRHRPQGVQAQKQSNNSLQQHISLRRKGQAAARVETPECFDEYSPYHPAFKSADLLDGSNNDQAGGRNRHGSGPFNHVPHISVDNRRTDLRIFKSPSFARRQPTTGFPERYIGLDNQTCERLKRIFGRIDGNASS